MPEQEDGLMWGFQLWVNLPAKDKMTAPRYQDIAPGKIPEVEPAPGVRVRVIAGRPGDTAGPIQAVATEPLYLDIALSPAARLDAPLPEGHNAFAYVFEGAARIGAGAAAKTLPRGELAVLGPGARARFAAGEGAGRLILVAGRPLHEPVARYGPFVMNTADEIRQAVIDYQSGRF